MHSCRLHSERILLHLQPDAGERGHLKVLLDNLLGKHDLKQYHVLSDYSHIGANASYQ